MGEDAWYHLILSMLNLFSQFQDIIICSTQQGSYCQLLGGCILSHCDLVGVGGSLYVALEIPTLHSGSSLEESFQEEHPPLLSSWDAPPGAVFAQLIKVELPPDSMVSNPL